jgi:hypothetical protein
LVRRFLGSENPLQQFSSMDSRHNMKKRNSLRKTRSVSTVAVNFDLRNAVERLPWKAILPHIGIRKCRDFLLGLGYLST